MPIIKVPYDEKSRAERGEKNAALLENLIGIKNKRILEVGCQLGDTTKVLARDYGCDVVGIDICPHPNWPELQKELNIKLYVADIADEHPALENNSFDRICSFVVWEHIRHPYSALKHCQKLLKPDRKKFLYANLYRSAMSSHLYWAIEEPWVNLVYSPDEIKSNYKIDNLAWYFWVNKLTYQQYLHYFRRLGFYITYENFVQKFFDENYYNANQERLELYPLWDLKTDFFQVVLEFDPQNPKQPISDPLYSYIEPKLVLGEIFTIVEESENRMQITWKVDGVKGGKTPYCYAFYVYRDDERIFYKWCSSDTCLQYFPDKSGNYHARIFVKDTAQRVAWRDSHGSLVAIKKDE